MYTKAIVRRPGRNFAEGITTANLGKPDFEKAIEQHSAYCYALTACGLELIILEADERYPDGCFVEDTAIVTGEAAVITRPGAESRMGEEAEISETLSEFRKIETIKSSRHSGWRRCFEGGGSFFHRDLRKNEQGWRKAAFSNTFKIRVYCIRNRSWVGPPP